MINYFNKNYQDDIISQYNIEDINYYLYHIASIQNIALTNLKISCVLNGCETYIIDKTNNNLVFYVYPGKFLTNIIFSVIESPIIIDTENSITSLTTGVLLNTDGKKVRCFLVDSDQIWNPSNEIFNPDHLIFAYFQLIHYQDKFRVYGSIFNNNYLKFLDNLDIEYNSRVAEVGYSSHCEQYQFSIFGVDLNILPLLIINEQRIKRNLQQYLVDNYTPTTTSKLISDVSIYSMRQERVTRHLSIFDGFYNDFCC